MKQYRNKKIDSALVVLLVAVLISGIGYFIYNSVNSNLALQSQSAQIGVIGGSGLGSGSGSITPAPSQNRCCVALYTNVCRAGDIDPKLRADTWLKNQPNCDTKVSMPIKGFQDPATLAQSIESIGNCSSVNLMQFQHGPSGGQASEELITSINVCLETWGCGVDAHSVACQAFSPSEISRVESTIAGMQKNVPDGIVVTVTGNQLNGYQTLGCPILTDTLTYTVTRTDISCRVNDCAPTGGICSPIGARANCNYNGEKTFQYCCGLQPYKNYNGRFAAPGQLCADRPTATISASPNPILKGQSSVVTWSSSNTSTCTISGGNLNPGKAKSGFSSTGTLQSSQTYSIVCTGIDGYSQSDPATATVVVNPANLSLPALSASPSKTCGGKVDLSWKAIDGATKYNLYDNAGILKYSGLATSYSDSGLTPGGSYYYTIYAIKDSSAFSSTPVSVKASDACSVSSTSGSASSATVTNPNIKTIQICLVGSTADSCATYSKSDASKAFAYLNAFKTSKPAVAGKIVTVSGPNIVSDKAVYNVTYTPQYPATVSYPSCAPVGNFCVVYGLPYSGGSSHCKASDGSYNTQVCCNTTNQWSDLSGKCSTSASIKATTKAWYQI